MTRTLFTGGLVYDGTTAAPAEGDVLVEDGRIVDVGPGLDGDEAVDCSGGFVSPGFFDCHVHVVMDTPSFHGDDREPVQPAVLQRRREPEKTLAAGVTSVRDAGGADLGIKTAVERGMIPGPRMQISIIMLSQTGGHGDDWSVCGAEIPVFLPHPGRPCGVVDGPDEVRKRVRELVRAGADVIKVATSGGVLSASNPHHGQLRDAEIATMTEEATAAGIHVMAHAQAAAGIKAALRNGVRSIEHGIFLDDEAIELMLETGAWLVPTLQAPREVIAAAEAGLPIPAESRRQGARPDRGAHSRPSGGPTKPAYGSPWAPMPGVGAHGTQPRGGRADDRHRPVRRRGAARHHRLGGRAARRRAATAARSGPGCGPTSWSWTAALTTSPGSGERVRAVYLDGVRVSRP